MLTVIADELPRVMACNGSVNMPAAFPRVDDPTARDEGNAAHYMAQAVFKGEYQLEELVDRKAPNGFYMTAEMADHVATYLSALDCGAMEVETSWGNEAFRVNGRADHISWRPELRLLTVDDFKYGYSIVEPFENWTLISHAIGYIIYYQISPSTIALRIHQPRPYHPDGKLRGTILTFDDLFTSGIPNSYYERIIATLTNPADELRTNPHCRYCRANPTCPAARKAGYNAIDATEAAVFSDDISDDLLAYELDTLALASKTLEARLDALGEMAKHRITNGAVVPNFHIEHQYANRRFKPEFDSVMISAMTGVDMIKSGTVTPAEAERRLVANGKSKERAATIVAPFTERPNTGLKLVRTNASRRAERLFGGNGK